MKNHIVVLLIVLGLQTKAQDLHFSQFFETQIIRNPALCGLYNGDVRATVGYRDQWNSFTNAYHTAFASAETKLQVGRQDYLAFGIFAVTDRSGSISLSTTQCMPTINYFKSLSVEKPMYISVGFSFGLFQRSFDASKITTNSQYIGNQYVPSASIGENFATNNILKLDAATGISFSTQLGQSVVNNLYFSAAYHHFNKPNISFYNNKDIVLAPKLAVNAGYKFAIGELNYFTTQADFTKQDKYTETIIGGMYSNNLTHFTDDKSLFIHGGLMYRYKDAIIPVLKLDVRKFTIGTSYDINISNLTKASKARGGFELTISYKGWNKNSTISNDERKLRCPKF